LPKAHSGNNELRQKTSAHDGCAPGTPNPRNQSTKHYVRLIETNTTGFVDVFATDGTLLRHDALHGPLHSPWGIAQAPADFGPMSNAILISNNIFRGRVNAFDPKSGGFLGPLRDASGNPIEIDNVWALQFGQDGGANGAHDQLFFTRGPNGYANGIFGVITFGQ